MPAMPCKALENLAANASEAEQAAAVKQMMLEPAQRCLASVPHAGGCQVKRAVRCRYR
jgi:hypothetical protein